MSLMMLIKEFDRIFEIRVRDLRSKKQKSFSIPNVKQFKTENAETLIKKIRGFI